MAGETKETEETPRETETWLVNGWAPSGWRIDAVTSAGELRHVAFVRDVADARRIVAMQRASDAG